MNFPIPDRSHGKGDLRSTPPLHSVLRVASPADFARARDFTNAHHSYIKWANRPSRKLYWLLFIGGSLVGVFALASAFARPKAVAEYMAKYKMAFNEVANNIIYCLHGHEDKNAGTRFLSLCRRDAKAWWGERYGNTLKALQTFVLPATNRVGTVYKADNWEYLVETAGKTIVTKTIRADDAVNHPKAERRVFKSGEIVYLERSFAVTPPKLIYMRRV